MSQFQLLAPANTHASNPTATSMEGGTVHVIDADTYLRRFLILGSFSTFYADGAKITQEATEAVRQYIAQDPRAVLDTVLDVARNRLALRKDPTLYVHAQLCQKDVRHFNQFGKVVSILDENFHSLSGYFVFDGQD